MSKNAVAIPEPKENDDLENQFILRLPGGSAVSEALRQTLRSGVMNVKDRLNISLDAETRKGNVQFDQWKMNAKLLDLPCIIESHKTIDNKSLYKTADICQILVCREGEEQSSSEDEAAVAAKPQKKKDPHKVDKKFLWPHGIAAPLKNVRKRRFRKTLKKKFVEAPEIEKEVRRLLRVDNEAVSVRWELITEEDEAKVKAANEAGLGEGAAKTVPLATGTYVGNKSRGLAEHEIFGEALSDSDEGGADDSGKINIMESDEEVSEDTFSSSAMNTPAPSRKMVTQFSRDMFREPTSSSSAKVDQESTRDALLQKIDSVRKELEQIQDRRRAQETELASIDNAALQQRLKSALDKLINAEQQKTEEYNQLLSMLS